MRDLYIRRMSLAEPLPRDSYLNQLPVVKHLAEKGIDFHKQVTFFVGENGSGKSTLIEALAISQHFNPEGGTKNFSFSTEDSHSELCSYLGVVRGALAEFSASGPSAASVAEARTTLLALAEMQLSDPGCLVDAALTRYSAGKDMVTGYKSKANSVTPASVKEILAALDAGSKVEFVVY